MKQERWWILINTTFKKKGNYMVSCVIPERLINTIRLLLRPSDGHKAPGSSLTCRSNTPFAFWPWQQDNVQFVFKQRAKLGFRWGKRTQNFPSSLRPSVVVRVLSSKHGNLLASQCGCYWSFYRGSPVSQDVWIETKSNIMPTHCGLYLAWRRMIKHYHLQCNPFRCMGFNTLSTWCWWARGTFL